MTAQTPAIEWNPRCGLVIYTMLKTNCISRYLDTMMEKVSLYPRRPVTTRGARDKHLVYLPVKSLVLNS